MAAASSRLDRPAGHLLKQAARRTGMNEMLETITVLMIAAAIVMTIASGLRWLDPAGAADADAYVAQQLSLSPAGE
jgi:hypothetical protein